MTVIDLDIEPMPCPRPRVRAIGKFAHAYYPAAYKNWKEEAAKQIRAAVEKLSLTQFTGPLAVNIHVRATKPRTSKLQFPKPDADNYAKSVLDAATSAELWADDSQVVNLEVFKRWRAGNEPRVRITITEIHQ